MAAGKNPPKLRLTSLQLQANAPSLGHADHVGKCINDHHQRQDDHGLSLGPHIRRQVRRDVRGRPRHRHQLCCVAHHVALLRRKGVHVHMSTRVIYHMSTCPGARGPIAPPECPHRTQRRHICFVRTRKQIVSRKLPQKFP